VRKIDLDRPRVREQAGPFHMDAEPTTTRGEVAAVGLGGNTGDVLASFRHAAARLGTAPGCRVVASSSLYETNPVGPIPQAAFLNAVVLVLTTLDPRALLGLMLTIERESGRDRTLEQRWGPRTLDLDLLVFGDRMIDEPELRVPHPRLAERLFVLEPLAEVSPDLTIPGHGLSASDLAWRLRGSQRADRVGLSWRRP
jgi:2-amino-4-hydroxy-6-hydroxymethyldihydropteridine diphosphokinase